MPLISPIFNPLTCTPTVAVPRAEVVCGIEAAVEGFGIASSAELVARDAVAVEALVLSPP